MDEQEREYLLENARRMELLEETPSAPSGRCSDMTEVEKEKLIDLLYDLNDRLKVQMAGLQEELRMQREQAAEQHNRLTTQLDRMEERAIAAERRADTSDKRAAEAEKRVAELTAALTTALDGTVIKNLESRVAKAEKERNDAKSADKQNRTDLYGTKRLF